MDRTGADFFRVINMMEERLHSTFVPIQLPIGSGDLFTGIIDLIADCAIMYEGEGSDTTFFEESIPEDLKALAHEYREKMIEAISDYDDHLMELFLEEKPIALDQIQTALRKATIAGKITPVMCGASFKNKGIRRLLDAIVDYLPSPVDVPPVKGHHPDTNDTIERKPSDEDHFSALAFKIATDPHVGKLVFFRVYSGLIHKGDTVINPVSEKKERLGRILRMHANKREEVDFACTGDILAGVGLKETVTGDTLCDQKHPIVLERMVFPSPSSMSPSNRRRNRIRTSSIFLCPSCRGGSHLPGENRPGNRSDILSGMGELHLEILVDRLRREFKVQANVVAPQVAYRESITREVEAEGKFIRQSGGRGQYGHVKIVIGPAEKGVGLYSRRDCGRRDSEGVHRSLPQGRQRRHELRGDRGFSSRGCACEAYRRLVP